MGLGKLFRKKTLPRTVVNSKGSLKDDDGSQTNSNPSSNSSLSCSLAEEPVLLTVATVMTDGVAVSTFVSQQGQLDDAEGDAVENRSSQDLDTAIAEEATKHDIDVVVEIQDEAAAALLLEPDDFSDMAVADDEEDALDNSDKAIADEDFEDILYVSPVAVPLPIAEEESPSSSNQWMCVNNNETINVENPDQSEAFLCLTWNLCGPSSEQIPILSPKPKVVAPDPVTVPEEAEEESKVVEEIKVMEFRAVTDEVVEFPMQRETNATEEEVEDAGQEMSLQEESKAPEVTGETPEDAGMEVSLEGGEPTVEATTNVDEEKLEVEEDSDDGMEVQLFADTQIVAESTEAPKNGNKAEERRYSIGSFSGDILAEEKLLPRAMEVLAKQQQHHHHDTQFGIEVEV